MSKDHSEPAFPSMSHEYGPVIGMSIRDYFAAQAMQASFQRHSSFISSFEDIARECYRIADRMLEARAK